MSDLLTSQTKLCDRVEAALSVQSCQRAPETFKARSVGYPGSRPTEGAIGDLPQSISAACKQNSRPGRSTRNDSMKPPCRWVTKTVLPSVPPKARLLGSF